MVFCNVCCEPFHQFCLDEHEQPQPENKDNWCCRRCQYCKVCGGRESGVSLIIELVASVCQIALFILSYRNASVCQMALISLVIHSRAPVCLRVLILATESPASLC